MRIMTFVYFVILISIITLLSVHEEVERVSSGYRCGEYATSEAKLQEEIGDLKKRYNELCAIDRLKQLNKDLHLNLGPLPSRSVKSIKLSLLDIE